MLERAGKSIIISAPSGAGKTTIVQELIKRIPNLRFSISACSRDPRPNEVDGKDYYFLGVEKFQSEIRDEAFLEWEEVYTNNYYGTLRSEVARIWADEKVVIFDVDVVGGLNLKRKLGEQALAVFIQAPTFETLETRLRFRSTETEEKIAVRLSKAQQEISRSPEFDLVIVNDELQRACDELEAEVLDFLAN